MMELGESRAVRLAKAVIPVAAVAVVVLLLLGLARVSLGTRAAGSVLVAVLIIVVLPGRPSSPFLDVGRVEPARASVTRWIRAVTGSGSSRLAFRFRRGWGLYSAG